MKALLMYRDRDFDLQQTLPWNAEALIQDLELGTLFGAMAIGDKFLVDVAQKAVLFGLHTDLDTIRYRQDILKDCLKNAGTVRDIYDIAVKAIEGEKKVYLGFYISKYPSTMLSRSLEVLQTFVSILRKLRHVADDHAHTFDSEGFTAFFGMLRNELSDDYFATLQNHLRQLQFRDGVLISAELGEGNKGANYMLRKPPEKQQNWFEQIFAKGPPMYTVYIADRDEAGARALSELKDRGLNLVANALAQSTDHILNFLTMLRTELAFYIGCLNLHEQLAKLDEPVGITQPAASGERRLCFQGLYDVCLALTMKQKVVGNDVNADTKELVIITGANQGGKSTFLRSVGLSQLMMQSGMFVPAESFCANVSDGLFTHYRREEDASMESGKLDEELSRLSDIIDHITSTSIVLFNESFAATNEREGSEIARQIITALLEKGIKVLFVTHLYECSRGFYERNTPEAMFLRAERQADGTRTFKIVEGEPLQTSYGQDLYQRVFANSALNPSYTKDDAIRARGVTR